MSNLFKTAFFHKRLSSLKFIFLTYSLTTCSILTKKAKSLSSLWKKALGPLCLLFAFTLQGCGQPSCGQGAIKLPSHEKKILRLNFSKSLSTFDPRKMGDHLSSNLGFMLFDGLTNMTKESSHSLALAETITFNEAKDLYTFTLREAFWSDGSLIRAEDFVRSWQTIVSQNFPSPSCQLLYPIFGAEKAKKGAFSPGAIGVKALDERTLEVKLERPTPFFLDLTSFIVLFPLHKSMERADEIAKENPEAFVCSGPFRLKLYLPDQEIQLEKNPFYWNQEAVFLDEIHISLVHQDTTAFYMYQKDQLDLIGFSFSQVPKDAVLSLKKKGELLFKPIAATTLCQFNTLAFPFYNKNFRKAVALAINRSEIVEHVTMLGEKIATSIISPLLKEGREDPFFPDGASGEARKYLHIALDELGCSLEDIEPIPYLYSISEMNTALAQAIAGQLSETLGIVIKPQGCEFKLFLDKLRRRDFMMSQSAWIAQYNDLMNILERFKDKEGPTNDPGWENPAYKKLLEESYFCKTKEERFHLLEEAEALFMEDLPQVPLFHWHYPYLQKPYVKGLYVSPIGSVHVTHVDLVKERKNS